jgi:hypothetical protein
LSSLLSLTSRLFSYANNNVINGHGKVRNG